MAAGTGEWWRRLSLRKDDDAAPDAFAEPARAPPGASLTAIGDVHGRLDLLEPILAAIETRARRVSGRRHVVILLGDLIDRGRDSFGVLDRLAAGIAGAETVILRGNHEDVLLRFLGGDPTALGWLEFGGTETLASYGIDMRAMRHLDMAHLRAEIVSAMPASHVGLLATLSLTYTAGDYMFVHAGARPGRPLNVQTEQDLIWIREEFLDSTYRFEKKIVHGHTPVPEPDFRRNRINLDTGAFASNRLTAALFEDDTVTLL